MSSTLYWVPVVQTGKSLPDELKYALRKKFGGYICNTRLLSGHIEYLNGLRDAGTKGAQELIDAIEKHGEIEISEES